MHGFKRKMFYVFQSNNLHSTTVRKVKKARDLDESDECRLTSSYIEPTTYTSLSNRCNAQEHNLLHFTGSSTARCLPLGTRDEVPLTHSM